MKKILSLTLALALTAALAAVPALAEEAPMPILPSPPADWPGGQQANGDVALIGGQPALSPSYLGEITVDGAAVDLSGIPGAPAGYLPMRAVCEAAGGYVAWYPQDHEAFFQLCGAGVTVDLTDLSVKLSNEPVEGVSAYLDPSGYTFLPLTFLRTIEDFQVDDHPELDAVRLDITTLPEYTEMEKLSQTIQETCSINAAETDPAILEMLGFDLDNYDELVALSPFFNVTSDVLLIAQVKEGRMDAAKEDFQAMWQQQYNNFERYLPDQFAKVKAAQTVVSPDGTHLMLVISQDPATAVEMFNAAYPQLAR